MALSTGSIKSQGDALTRNASSAGRENKTTASGNQKDHTVHCFLEKITALPNLFLPQYQKRGSLAFAQIPKRMALMLRHHCDS